MKTRPQIKSPALLAFFAVLLRPFRCYHADLLRIVDAAHRWPSDRILPRDPHTQPRESPWKLSSPLECPLTAMKRTILALSLFCAIPSVMAAESGRFVSVSPSSFIGGQATTVSVQVQNTGDSDDMFIEADSWPSGWAVSPKNVNPYMTGGSYNTASFTVTPPVTGGSGTIVWKFYDDDIGVHPTGSDLLATYNQSVSATAIKPDLIAYTVSVNDSSVDPGQTVTVNWTAKNQGQASAGATQQGVMWSTDSTITRSDTLLDREYLGSMGVNVTSSEAHSITIPAGATPGQTYYIGVYADYDLGVDESSEANNASSAVAVTVNAPDLIAYSGSVSDSTVDPGQSITVNWTAKNQGTGSAGSSQQGVMWSTDSTVTRSDTLLDREYLGSMSVNATSAESHGITIPSGATPGQTYYIGLYADYDLGVNEGSSEGNNGSSAVAVTINAPDLRVTSTKMAGSTSVDQHFNPSQAISLDFEGYNGGNGKSKSNVQMKWYYGTSANAKTTYIDVGYLGTINGLAVGEYESETDASWSVPTAPGTYWLTVVIDSDGNNAESNEGNNEATMRFYVDAPDLIAYSVSVSDTTVDPGQTITINWTAKNQGSGSAGATQQGVMWSTDGTIARTDSLMDREYLGSMAANATSPESHAVTIPAGATPGQTYYIGVFADYDLEVDEGGNEGNNGSSALAVTINAPDLRVTSMKMAGSTSVDQPFNPSQAISLDFEGYNGGNGKSKSNVQMKWYYGTSANAKTTYIDVGYLGTINGLAVGEYEPETDASWSVPTTPGTYWLTVVIDSDGNNAESNEGNNEATMRFYVDAPDLIANSVSVSDTTVDPGQSITVNWTAKNQGSGSAGATQQGVMWSTDGTIARTDSLMDREYLGSMAANATSPESHAVTIPAGATPGQTYYIGVFADYDLEIDEGGYEGNNSSSAVAVTVNLPLTETRTVASPRHVRPGQVVRLSATIEQNGPSGWGEADGLNVDIYVDGNKVSSVTASGSVVTLDYPVPSTWGSGIKTWYTKFSGNVEYAASQSANATLTVSVPPWTSESAPYGIVDHLPHLMNSDGKRRDDPEYRYRYARFGVVIANDNVEWPEGNANLSYPQKPASIGDYQTEFFVMRSPRNFSDSEPERCFSPVGEYIPWSALTVQHDSANRQIVLQGIEDGWNYHLFRKLHLDPAALSAARDENNTPIGAGTRKLVIITHGWNPDSNDDPFGGDLGLIASRMNSWLSANRPTSGWQVWRYNWGLDAATGPIFSQNGPYPSAIEKQEQIEALTVDTWPTQNGTEAAEAGHLHGEMLGEYLLTLPNLEQVQIIAHSAGTWVAHNIAYHFLQAGRDVDVQVSLLDPYMPKEGGAGSALGVEVIGQLDSGYAAQPRRLENYYSKWDGFDGVAGFHNTGTAQTFDWSTLTSEQMQLDNGAATVLEEAGTYWNHSGPLKYYADTITGDVIQETFWGVWAGANHGWAVSLPFLSENNSPTNIILSNSMVPENEPAGTMVGTLMTIDTDINFTYALVGGPGSEDNGSFTIIGNTLQAASPFNYEGKTSYTIRIRSTDQSALWHEKIFIVSVLDLPEQPFGIGVFGRGSAGGLTFSWPCEAGYSYQLQYSDDVQGSVWHDIGPAQTWSSGPLAMTYSDMTPVVQDKRFFRIVRTLLP